MAWAKEKLKNHKGMLNKKHSDNTKKKIGNANKIALTGKKLSDLHKKNIQKGHFNIYNSGHFHLRQSNCWIGKHHKVETKQKIKNTLNIYYKTHSSPFKGKTFKHTDIAKNKIRKANASRKYPYTNTSIEIKLQNELKSHSILFETHKYSLFGTPDIFIEPNICIFADGCYWHACPTCQLNKIQSDKNHKDIKITQKLKQMGFKVYRFWEHEINENIEKCIKSIDF